MKFSNQKISLDNHRKKEEYGGNRDHLKLMTDVRKVPKSNFDILYQIGFRVGY